nr:reverse transcriptase domain-containing protein [Tanacetum cinerariifolium]
MSAIANTTPIVTTVTKPATNPRDTDATPRVNIQDLCEEYYEDILKIIMDKVIEGRVHSTDLAKPTRRAQPSPDQAGQTPGIILMVEAVPAGWTLQLKIVLRIENAFMTLKSRMMTLTLLSINNLELTKRLNEHVPKTMKEMMITTTTFIRGEAVAASKKKGHTSWRAREQSKRQTLEKNSDFRGKFQPSPPMVTPVENRSSNKFCDFYNDKGHNTDEFKGREEGNTSQRYAPAIYFKRVKEIMFPPLTTSSGVEGPLVIEAEMGGHMIHRMYMDEGSSMKIHYEDCFNRLQPEVKNQMVQATTSLTGFSGETIWPLGQLRILVIIGDADHSTRAWMNFMILRSLSPYNGIIGRSGIREIQAVPSTAHGMLKFPEVGSRLENFKVALHPDVPDQEVAIKGMLSAKGCTELCSILKNLDIFAWRPSDITGGPGPERAKAIQAEIQKLVEEGIMREVCYQDWLSNPVMVKKHDGSLWMCVDFMDLNKACPQDCYPFQEIDWKVESLCGYPFKCFLDAYKGYHQIKLADPDEEKTVFHTGQGVYCYTKMPFGLKNVGATYQRLVDKAFDSQTGRNIEVYVNDLVVKSHTEAEMLRDIDEMFRTLRKINMKLNLKKCTFGAAEGVFLGYVAKRLQRYFQAHPITVITDQPIKQIMSCPDMVGRLQKWSVMLEEHNITYRPRTSLKGHILADFVIEMSDENPPATPMTETQQEPWTLFTDGSSSNQVLGTYVTKEKIMIKYLEKVKSLVSGFTNFSISQVPRSKNKKADALSKIASTSFAHLSKQVLVEILKEKYIKEKEVTIVVEEDGPMWMTSIMEYLKEGTLSSDRKEARKLRIKARQAKYVIREIHDGSCSMHAGPRSVVGKAIRLGYYWPTMHWDACVMIRTCNGCQIHCPITRNPQQPLTPIMALLLFYKWGIDIVDPFPEGPERRKRSAIREAKANLKMTKYYNARVRGVLSTAVITLVMLWKEGSYDQSGKDLT